MPKLLSVFSIFNRFKDTMTSVFLFPLTVDFLCSCACCDLSLSALSCCKSMFYLLEGVNGHMGVRNLTDKSDLLLISPQFCFISAYKIQNSLIRKPCSVFAERSFALWSGT